MRMRSRLLASHRGNKFAAEGNVEDLRQIPEFSTDGGVPQHAGLSFQRSLLATFFR